jgi:uncharacterized protein YozE (UPF0346 family)
MYPDANTVFANTVFANTVFAKHSVCEIGFFERRWK